MRPQPPPVRRRQFSRVKRRCTFAWLVATCLLAGPALAQVAPAAQDPRILEYRAVLLRQYERESAERERARALSVQEQERRRQEAELFRQRQDLERRQRAEQDERVRREWEDRQRREGSSDDWAREQQREALEASRRLDEQRRLRLLEDHRRRALEDQRRRDEQRRQQALDEQRRRRR